MRWMWRRREPELTFRAIYDKFGPNNTVECRFPDGVAVYLPGAADLVGDESRREELVGLAERERSTASHKQ